MLLISRLIGRLHSRECEMIRDYDAERETKPGSVQEVNVALKQQHRAV